MRVVAPIDEQGNTGESWGHTHWMAVAEVSDGSIATWEVIEVAWDEARAAGTPAEHHERVVQFVKDQRADAVVVAHMCDRMTQMMNAVGVTRLDATPGDARASVLDAVAAR